MGEDPITGSYRVHRHMHAERTIPRSHPALFGAGRSEVAPTSRTTVIGFICARAHTHHHMRALVHTESALCMQGLLCSLETRFVLECAIFRHPIGKRPAIKLITDLH